MFQKLLGAVFLLFVSLLIGCESEFRETESNTGTVSSSTSQVLCDNGVCNDSFTFNSGVTFNSTVSCTGCISTTQISDASIVNADIANTTITSGKISPGSENDVMITNAAGTVSWQKQHYGYGTRFTRPTVSTVSLVPSGIDSKATVLVSNGSNLIAVSLTATLTADITSSGAGGLDTGAEAASTGYDVYLITQDSGANPQLILTVSGSAVTMPATYTHRSELLWFVSNTAGGGNADFADFTDIGNGICLYAASGGIAVLSSGTSVANTAIDFTGYVPTVTRKLKLRYSTTNTHIITLSRMNLSVDAAGVNLIHSGLSLMSAVGFLTNEVGVMDLELSAGITNSLYYVFSANTGSQSLNVYVQSFEIPRRM